MRWFFKDEIQNQTDKEQRRVLLEQIECIAAEHQTNFNHVVVRRIEACLAEDDGYTGRGPLTPLSRLRRQLPSRGAFSFSLPLRGVPPKAAERWGLAGMGRMRYDGKMKKEELR